MAPDPYNNYDGNVSRISFQTMICWTCSNFSDLVGGRGLVHRSRVGRVVGHDGLLGEVDGGVESACSLNVTRDHLSQGE